MEAPRVEIESHVEGVFDNSRKPVMRILTLKNNKIINVNVVYASRVGFQTGLVSNCMFVNGYRLWYSNIHVEYHPVMGYFNAK